MVSSTRGHINLKSDYSRLMTAKENILIMNFIMMDVAWVYVPKAEGLFPGPGGERS